MPRCSRPSPLRSLHIFVLPITHTCSFQLLRPLANLPSFPTYLSSYCNHFHFRRDRASHASSPNRHASSARLSFVILDSSSSASQLNIPPLRFLSSPFSCFFLPDSPPRPPPRRHRRRIFEFVARIPRRSGRPRGRNGTEGEPGIGALVLNARTNRREWNFVVESAAPNEAKTEKTDVLYPVPEAFSPGDRWKGGVEKRDSR